MLKVLVIFSIAFVFLALIPNSFAQEPTIKISTEKETYYYGDYFTFTIEVSELSEEIAIMHIVDANGKSSSPIPIGVVELTTTLTSPFPFDSTTYPQGKYTLDIQYAGVSSSTEFFLEDSGAIVIPVWIKDLGKMWAQDLISDGDFVKAIEYLIKNDIIEIPETQSSSESDESNVPSWIKTTTGWWVQGIVSDNEFGKALEYLIKNGVIKI